MGSERTDEPPRHREATRLDAEYRRTYREAVRAVASRRPGRDLAAIREALGEELRSRGVDPTPQDLASGAEMVRAAQGPLAPLRLARMLGQEAAGIRAILREGEGPEWLRAPDGVNLFEEGMSAASAEVRLVEEAQPFLMKAFDALYDPEWDDDEEVVHSVWIDGTTARGDGSLRFFLGNECVGELDEKGAQAISRQLAKATKRGRPLVLEGFLERKNGRVSVWVNVPARNQ